LAARALSLIPLGNLQRSPDPIAGFRRPISKVPTFKERGRQQRGGEGRGAKMTYSLGRQKPVYFSPLESTKEL